jgi:hypothetical protein
MLQNSAQSTGFVGTSGANRGKAVDEDFEYFLEKMGPAFDRRDVPSSTLDRYRGKLPDQLLAYWEEHGWCGYADGLFWTVDPEEYEPSGAIVAAARHERDAVDDA